MKSDKVEFWDDERDIDNGIIVTLKFGWSFEPTHHEGVRGFDTVAEAKLGVSEAFRCNCQECQAFLSDSE